MTEHDPGRAAPTRSHHYDVTLTWSGDTGRGYRGYDRTHTLSAPGKPDLIGSADPHFRGDPARWNPEELLVAALSACHQLWYLALCAHAGIAVTGYRDQACGVMVEHRDGSGGEFTEVVLAPQVTVAAGTDLERARALHQDAHNRCFVARSVNFPIKHTPTIAVA